MIHPTAVVHPKAQVGPNCDIGPYCVVGEHVVLGAGCRLYSHVVIEGHTRLGDALIAVGVSFHGASNCGLGYESRVSAEAAETHSLGRPRW